MTFAIINLNNNEIYYGSEFTAHDICLRNGWGLKCRLVCIDVENTTYDLTQFKKCKISENINED